MKTPVLLVLLALLPRSLFAEPVFLEKGGILAIEAESTASPLGKWKKKTDVAEFMGECHLEFTGNQISKGPPISPLKYQFTINKGGLYELTIRARKRLENERLDLSNDCYVAVKGNFQSGGDVPLEVLKDDTKMYGGDPDKWGWTRLLDVSHKKYGAQYLFKEGESYQLTIHGRSKNFNFDRILFVHQDEGLRNIQKKNPQESAQSDGPYRAQTAAPTQRTLTNKKGETVLAKLLSKDGDKLAVIIKERSHQLKISDLSQEDQEFLKEWQP